MLEFWGSNCTNLSCFRFIVLYPHQFLYLKHGPQTILEVNHDQP